MRKLAIIPFLVFLLAACSSAPSSAAGQTQPQPTVNTKPTQFNAGQCVDARQPTPDPNQPSLFARVNQQDHILGPSNAAVTVMVYSDFQCSACANLASRLKAIVSKYPNDVRVVFRNFPLISIHDKAALSAQAAEAAGLQEKFWGMHDFLFSNQNQWKSLKPADFQKWILKQSAGLGLDPVKFEIDLTSPQIVTSVQKSWDDGQKINLPGAPLILINGEIIKWQVNLLDQLEILIKLATLPQKQFSTCPSIVINPAKQYSATIKTTLGDISIKLFADQAPHTVNNFIFLAQKGWFDNNPFIRNYPSFLVITGDPSGTGLGGPGYFISSENNNLRFDRSGLVAMKNSGPDSNGSLFFITLVPDSKLNSQFTIFGAVTNGMDVVSRLAAKSAEPSNTTAPPDVITSVLIEEK